jgi:hypothetical protein
VFQRATVPGGAWLMPEKWWARLSFCPSSLPVAPLPAKPKKKKHKSQQQAAPFHLGFFSSASYRSGFLDFGFYSVSSRRQGRGHGPEGRHCWRREERLRVLLLPLGAVRPVVKEIGCCFWWPVCGLC